VESGDADADADAKYVLSHLTKRCLAKKVL